MATWQKVVTESAADTITQKVSNTTLSSAGVVKTDANGALSSGTIASGNIASNAVTVGKLSISNAEPSNDTSALFWNNTAGEMQWGAIPSQVTVDTSITDGGSNPVTGDAIFDALALKQDALTIDTAITNGSSNPVTNDAIHDALANKAAKAGDSNQSFSTNNLTVAGTLTVSNPVEVNSLTSSESLKVVAANNQAAGIELHADGGDDDDDYWQMEATTDGNWRLFSKESGSWVAKLTVNKSGNVTIANDLYVGGATVTTSTETLEIGDNTLVLNSDTSTAADAGFVVELGGPTFPNLYHDSTNNQWKVADNTSAAIGGSYRADVMSLRKDSSAPADTDAQVGVGHMWWSGSALYVRTA